MILIHKDKATNKLTAFGSMVAIANNTGIKLSRLTTTFTRKKLSVYEDENVYIQKSKIIRSEHK